MVHVKRIKWTSDKQGGSIGYSPWKPASMVDEDLEVLALSIEELRAGGFTYEVEEDTDGVPEVTSRGPLPRILKQ